MKCLSIQQPWAWSIVGSAAGGVTIDGPKRIENRGYPLRHRGPMLIHAGKSMGRWRDEGMRPWWQVNVGTPPLPQPGDVPKGAIVGIVIVHACFTDRAQALACCEKLGLPPQRAFADKQRATAHYIVFSRARAFERPVMWRGMLFLFDVSPEMVPEADAILSGWEREGVKMGGE